MTSGINEATQVPAPSPLVRQKIQADSTGMYGISGKMESLTTVIIGKDTTDDFWSLLCPRIYPVICLRLEVEKLITARPFSVSDKLQEGNQRASTSTKCALHTLGRSWLALRVTLPPSGYTFSIKYV